MLLPLNPPCPCIDRLSGPDFSVVVGLGGHHGAVTSYFIAFSTAHISTSIQVVPEVQNALFLMPRKVAFSPIALDLGLRGS